MRPLSTDLIAILSATLVVAAFAALYFAVQNGIQTGAIQGMPPAATLMLAVACVRWVECDPT